MVKCGYCDKDILDQNLSTHCRDRHNSFKYAAGDTHVTSYFAINKKRKLSSVDSEISCDSASSEELPSEELEQTGSNSNEESTAVLANEQTSTTTDNAKLDEILSRVKDIQISVKQSGEKPREKLVLPPIAKPDDISPTDTRISQINLARSLNDIIDNFSELRACQQPDFAFVICKLCCSDDSFKKAESTESLNQTK